MLLIEELLSGLSHDLTLHFFLTMARLEFAMKATRLLKSDKDGKLAEASRRKLAAKLRPSFFADVKVTGDAEELIDRPPKKLLVRTGTHPQFGPQPSALTDTLGLLNAVWDVRNNLFHGNKANPGDRKRDTALMYAALAVIKMVLEENAEIANAFREPQQFA